MFKGAGKNVSLTSHVFFSVVMPASFIARMNHLGKYLLHILISFSESLNKLSLTHEKCI